MGNTYSVFSITTTDSDYFGAMVPGIGRRVNVIDKDLAAAPGAPAEGARYIVPVAGWGGLYANTIAEYHAYTGGTAAWRYFTPPTGFIVYVGALYVVRVSEIRNLSALLPKRATDVTSTL
jgi:hypothetical protein